MGNLLIVKYDLGNKKKSNSVLPSEIKHAIENIPKQYPNQNNGMVQATKIRRIEIGGATLRSYA